MKRSLYYKFIFGYLLFGLLGFLIISTFSSKMTYEHLLAERADLLYDEANQLATEYSAVYNGKNVSLSQMTTQLSTFSPALQSEIWVVNRNGTFLKAL